MNQQDSRQFSPKTPFNPSTKHSKIKPLIHINPKPTTISNPFLHKYQTTFKNMISADIKQRKNLLLTSRQYTKHFLKILQTQSHPSSLCYRLFPSRIFEDAYFSSKIKNLQTLSTLKFEVEGDRNPSSQLGLIVKSLPYLKGLTHLRIQFISYKLKDLAELRRFFKKILPLKNLISLSFEMFSCYFFEPSHSSVFASFLKKFTRLQSLRLSFPHSISEKDKCLNALIHAFSSLKSLVQLDLNFAGYDFIKAESFVKLFIALGSITTLTDITLNFRACQRTNENNPTAESIAEALLYLNTSSIRKFDLYPCQNIGKKGLGRLFQALKKFTFLEILDLHLIDFLRVSNEDMTELNLTLSTLASLTSFSLSLAPSIQAQNTLSSISSAFRFMQNLAYLKLDFQCLQNSSCPEIQEFSLNLKTLKFSLKFLYLNFSQQPSVSDITVENVGEAVKELALLKHLYLIFSFSGSFTNKGLKIISTTIQELSNLSYFALSLENCLQISAFDALARALRHTPSLYSVRFNFRGCDIKFEGDGWKILLKTLREVDNIWEINLNQSFSPEIEKEVNKLKLTKSVEIF